MSNIFKNFFQVFYKQPKKDATELIEIRDLVLKNDSISKIERQAILRFLDLTEYTLDDIKVPRSDIVGVELDSDFFTVIKKFSAVDSRQIPVFEENIDKIVGYINLADVLAQIDDPRSFSVERIKKEIPFVVPTMKVMDVVLQMQDTGAKVSVLIDEFGGVDGLIIFSKIMEEIFGEFPGINNGIPMITKTPNPLEFIVNAKAEIEDCEEAIGVKLLVPLAEGEDTPDIETIGGLVITIAGNVPNVGDIIFHPSGIEFVIVAATPRRVEKILVRKKSANIR